MTFKLTGLFIGAVLLCPCSRADTLLAADFNAGRPWPGLAVRTQGGSVQAQAQWRLAGTVDEVGTDKSSGALQLSVDASASAAWQALPVSGALPVRNREADLGKLTLAFMLSASSRSRCWCASSP